MEHHVWGIIIYSKGRFGQGTQISYNNFHKIKWDKCLQIDILWISTAFDSFKLQKVYDNDFRSIINIYFYETFSNPTSWK
jgi:hypothetical protein